MSNLYTTSSHIGFIGTRELRLQDFREGEYFKNHAGDECKVIGYSLSPDHIEVWINPNSATQARKTWYHRTARVYAVSPEQAAEISRR